MTPGLGGVLDNVAATDPTELQALLSQTVAQLFGNARDDKVRRVFELTYFQPAFKQQAVAERLALSFGTYRRHLTAGRERLARWLWERSRLVTAEADQPVSPFSFGGGSYYMEGVILSAGAALALIGYAFVIVLTFARRR